MSTAHTSASPSPTQTGADLTHLAERVDRVVAEAAALEPDGRAKALALKSAIEDFHRAGITTIVKTLKTDPRGKELLFALATDPTVYALLSLHGVVHSSPPGERPAPQVPLELVQIELPVMAAGSDGQKRRRGDGWMQGPKAESVTADRAVSFEAGEASVVVIRSQGGLRAFRNACPHQGLPLERGVCDAVAGTLTCPWHGFQFDGETGECFSAPQCRLDSFPLRETDGFVWVRTE